jgi:hypothetical protein
MERNIAGNRLNQLYGDAKIKFNKNLQSNVRLESGFRADLDELRRNNDRGET